MSDVIGTNTGTSGVTKSELFQHECSCIFFFPSVAEPLQTLHNMEWIQFVVFLHSYFVSLNFPGLKVQTFMHP